jgi:hypothetical protein
MKFYTARISTVSMADRASMVRSLNLGVVSSYKYKNKKKSNYDMHVTKKSLLFSITKLSWRLTR